jgi:hypothetical protein
MEKATKEMQNKEIIGYDDMPGHVFEVLGKRDLEIMTLLINSIYETGEWPKDFTKVTMIALKKKTKATKCNDHRTISLISHTAKIITKILKRRIERKIEDILGGDQVGLRRENNCR